MFALLVPIAGDYNVWRQQCMLALLVAIAGDYNIDTYFPHVSGWMFDLTGHYDDSFYAAGGWMMLSGVLLLPIPYIMRRQEREDG